MKELIRKILFWIFFKKIPKTNFGRCIECDANQLCGSKVKCTATMEQQYKEVSIKNIIKNL